MCEGYRANAKPAPHVAPESAFWHPRSWGKRIPWGLVSLGIAWVGGLFMGGGFSPRVGATVPVATAACVESAFWLLKVEEIKCGPGLSLDIDYAKGWATCRCDHMAPLRDAWAQDFGNHMGEIDKKLEAHQHQFEVVAMQFDAVFVEKKKQDERLKELTDGMNALGYQKAIAAKAKDDAHRGGK